MCTNMTVFDYVSGRAQRSSLRRHSPEEMKKIDKVDAIIGEVSFEILVPDVQKIVRQLKAFSNCEFHVHFKAHSQRGVAQVGGHIILDYSLLNKPVIEIAQTLAHEWGHLALGHVVNPYWFKAVTVEHDVAEQEADFYSGVFLGVAGYELDEIVNLKLSLPDEHDHHGSRLQRAYYIACGYHHGVARKEAGLEGVPGGHVFERSALEAAMPPDADNKFRN